MTIVFICGSLEQGKDGVGDYTRQLAAELLRLNHQVSIIAIHDRYLPESTIVQKQPEREQQIPVLRLSNQLSWEERKNKARTHVAFFNPDWISLQYVPFSFHDRGLSIHLARTLKEISANRLLHIMFHEVWLGLSKQSSYRHILWGIIQRQLISSMLKTCKPSVTHTHTHLYQYYLSNLNIQPSILPLFANIPVVESQKTLSVDFDFHKSKFIRFVIFGGIFANAPVEHFTAEVAAYAKKTQKIAELIFIGRNGSQQLVWESIWQKHGLSTHNMGERKPNQISDTFRKSSIGISTTPVLLAGKSGSIAAMQAHGLPIVCVSAPWTSRHPHVFNVLERITAYEIGNFESFVKNLQKKKAITSDVNKTTEQFLSDLLFFKNKNKYSL